MSTFPKPHWKRNEDHIAAVTGRDQAPFQNSQSIDHSVSDAHTPQPQTTTVLRGAMRPRAERSTRTVTADEIMFTTKEAARYIHYIYSHRSLERFRTDGGNKGPEFVKIPGEKGRVLYRKTDLDRWLKEMRTFRSTSEYGRSYRRGDTSE